MLGCQVRPGEAVYVHAVGTFGSNADMSHVLVADEFHLEAGGPEYPPALLAFVVCVVAGVPLSWPKTAGSDVVTLDWFRVTP